MTVNFGSIMGVGDKSSGHGTRSLEESRAEYVAAETADNFYGSGLEFLCHVGTPVFRTCSVISGLPESVQTRATGPRRFVLQTAGSYGSSVPSGSAGPDSHKAIPLVNQRPRGVSTLASLLQGQGYAQRLLYLASVDKILVSFQRGPVRRGLSLQDDHDRCLPDGLGCGLPWSIGFRSLGRGLMRLAHKLSGDVGSARYIFL